MQHANRHGFTLLELLIVMGLVALVLIAITGLSVQAARIYAKHSGHIEPQSSQMSAMLKIQNAIRLGMQFHNVDEEAEDLYRCNEITVLLPEQESGPDGQKVNKVQWYGDPEGQADPENNLLTLGTGESISLTLEEKEPFSADPRVMLYRMILMRYEKNSAEPIKDPATGLPKKDFIIEGISVVRADPANPGTYANPGNLIPATIFSFSPFKEDGTPDDTASMVTITLTSPVIEETQKGPRVVYHQLSTRFCARNFNPNL